MPASENYQTDISIYDVMAFKSFINKTNLSPSILPTVANSLFYDQAKAKSFFLDTLLYLHLYNGILIELIIFNKENSNNVERWEDLIDNLKIQVIDSSTSGNTKIITLDRVNKTIILNLTAFTTNYLNDESGSNKAYDMGASYNTQTYYINLLPIIKSGITEARITQFTADFGSLFSSGAATVVNLFEQSAGTITLGPYDKTNTVTPGDNTDEVGGKPRFFKLRSVIREILNIPFTNILGYLLFYKIYYNIILFNIQIVEYVRTYYLLNTKLRDGSPSAGTVNGATITGIDIDTSTRTFFDTGENGKYVVDNINSIFTEKKTQLDALNLKIFNDLNTADTFDKNKWIYTRQITDLNNVNNDLKLNETKLNIALREYNKYTKNFNNIRSYATYVIIFLIVIILATIAITIIGGISSEFKNFYYLIAFFILGIVTYLYYDNYNHVGLYEDFTVIADETSLRTAITPSVAGTNGDILANIRLLYNKVLPSMNDYNKAITDIFEKLRGHIYTIGNDVFYKDGNIYLYKTYLQKKKQFEANRIRLVGTLNSIEIMKKYVKYLFNIILLMSLLTLILLFGLLLFINLPFFVVYIIIFCVILIIIVSVTFIVAITRPTRMTANKNYWADMTAKTSYIKKLR